MADEKEGDTRSYFVHAQPGWWAIYRDADKRRKGEPLTVDEFFGQRIIGWRWTEECWLGRDENGTQEKNWTGNGSPVTLSEGGLIDDIESSNLFTVAHEGEIPEEILKRIDCRWTFENWQGWEKETLRNQKAHDEWMERKRKKADAE
jgi:hypothetical protein